MKKQKSNPRVSKRSSRIDKQPEPLESIDYFNILPDEMVFMIFRDLSKKDLQNCSAVCLRWRKISSDFRLQMWSQISIHHETVTLAHLVEVIERGVRRLQLFCVTVTDSDTEGQPFTPNYDNSRLEKIIAVRPNTSALGLASIIECTSRLRELDISRCTLDKRIANAIGRNTEMRILRLNGCQGLDKVVMTTILKGCYKIRELGLCGTGLSTETLNAMIPYLSESLSHLNIRYCGRNLVDKHLKGIFLVCPRLTTLEVGGNTGLSFINAAFPFS